jgi:predicted transcriptional regulator
MTPEPAIFDDLDEAAEAAADAQAISEIDAGEFISHDAMKAWLLSWGTPNELPPPNVGD